MVFARIKDQILSSVALRRLGPEVPGTVLLTFDDGPHPRVTPAVLDRLAAHGARAVFFVIGRRIANAPELLHRIEAEGHVIGNHSFRHERGAALGFRGYRADVRACQEAIHEHTGRGPVLFRPPFGERSLTTLLAARSLGLRPMLWSLDEQDWRCRTHDTAGPTAERMIAKVQSRDVVLLHDDHDGVLTILDRMLPVLCDRGFDLARGVAGLTRRWSQAEPDLQLMS